MGKQKRLCTVIETKRGKKEREGSGGEMEGGEEGGWKRDEPAKKMTADETGAREGGREGFSSRGKKVIELDLSNGGW